jgi:hypothetical protein
MASGVYTGPRHRQLRLDFARARLLRSPAVAHTRRTFLGGVASLAATTTMAARSAHAQTPPAPQPKPAGPPPTRNIKLGLDNFAIRANGWKAPQLI